MLPYPALSELLNSSTPKSCQITPIGDRPRWHGQGTQMGWVARMGSAQSMAKESEGAQDLVQVCFTPFCSKKTCRKKSKRSVHLNSGCSTVGSPAAEMEGNGEPRAQSACPGPSIQAGLQERSREQSQRGGDYWSHCMAQVVAGSKLTFVQRSATEFRCFSASLFTHG